MFLYTKDKRGVVVVGVALHYNSRDDAHYFDCSVSSGVNLSLAKNCFRFRSNQKSVRDHFKTQPAVDRP